VQVLSQFLQGGIGAFLEYLLQSLAGGLVQSSGMATAMRLGVEVARLLEASLETGDEG
jgi:hypothetical protein